MTTLKNLKGTAIQFLDADPVVYAGSWSSGGDLNTYVDGTMGSGIQTAALKFGGQMDPGTSPRVRAETEQYNGSTWTEVSDLNTARYSGGGLGLQTASLCFGGEPGSLTNTESWNGSAWTEVNDLNTGRAYMADFGRLTSGFSVGGKTPGDDDVNNVESWDGTSWTETTEINTARRDFAGGGVGTSGLVFGGREAPGVTGKTEFWNGSSWTEKADLNTARYWLSGSGTDGTSVLAFGGFIPPNTGKTENYDGSTWTEVADLALARREGASGNASANTASIFFGGFATSYPQGVATEEWSFPGPTSSILQEGDMWFNSTSSTLKGYGTAAGIPAGTWASGGSLNTAKYQLGTAGTQTATLAFGGSTPPFTSTNESYNGTSWTEL